MATARAIPARRARQASWCSYGRTEPCTPAPSPIEQGNFVFAYVPPGVWQVLLTLSGNYQVTTGANPAEVTVTTGITYTLDYGIAPVATPTATPTATGSPTPTATATRWRVYLPLVLMDN